MSLSFILPTVVSTAAGLGFLAWITPGPWHRETLCATSPEAIAADAPMELRTAVLIVANPAHTDLMFATLKLGSFDSGVPRVEGWDYDSFGLHIDVLMLGGQSLEDWNNDTTRSRLAAYLGVERVTVTSPAPAWVRLHVRVYDTLAASVTMPRAVPNDVDLEAVPVGVREDGWPWLLRILYAHVLIAGATGSGKGSVLWSILAGLGPAIQSKLVAVWMADPKGGAEFGRGADKLFTRFAADAANILGMLTEAVTELDERLARMRSAGIRKLIPSVDEPLILLVIDEAASLSSYASREERDEFRRLSGLLLSKGRAAGITVVSALQDPSKETMPNRQLFPVRVGLRLDEPTQNAMVHGQGAKDRGARCDEISETTPGVAYVGEDGTTEFVRVRAFYISDEDADAIVDTYSPAPEITGPTEDYSDFDPDDLGDENPEDDGLAGVAA
ncbi:FtsK/SpoIIIE domain-containing protein [Nocardia sp. NPDC050406]|uniref:FtsK/SpoIIIE domain-containing protein n=1 Tax=Nocardia sp. NPDC050406 TaxID=3364318 RepID=UPI0037ACF18E